MTVTISRLYDSYAQATEAVSNLEKAGVPRSDISIVSNNSDNWYSENTARRTTNGPATIDRDRDGVDDRAEGAGTGAGIGATAASSGYGDVDLEPAPHRSSSRFPFRFTLA